MDFAANRASRDSIPIDFEEDETPEAADPAQLHHRIAVLEALVARDAQRIGILESLVARDEDVLRRLFGFLVSKQVGTRDEFVNLLG